MYLRGQLQATRSTRFEKHSCYRHIKSSLSITSYPSYSDSFYQSSIPNATRTPIPNPESTPCVANFPTAPLGVFEFNDCTCSVILGHVGLTSTSLYSLATHNNTPFVHPNPACTAYSPPLPALSTSSAENFSNKCPFWSVEAVKFNVELSNRGRRPGMEPPVAYQLQKTLVT